MKESEQVQNLFKEKFGSTAYSKMDKDIDILLDPNAVTFLHKILKYNVVSFIIITRNRADYIQELLKYQGFTEDEIKKIIISDDRFKFDVVTDTLKQLPEKATQLYILDDDEGDFEDMVLGAIRSGYSDSNIKPYKESPGQFDWLQYLNDVEKSLLPASPKSVGFFASKESSKEEIVDTKKGLSI
ncbi:hypothetical protein ACQUW5_10810 [Legionella sp. CNM-1927-20]|uniref:hypothetical protein n=1 Tax=Legionella sp. CNM-1927-20 TaxID=3422221 RepID=UPI00403B0946